ETGGDYFDYITLGDSVTEIVVGDVSGHGYGPALVMAATPAYLRALAATQAPFDDALAIVNRVLNADVGDAPFVTLMPARIGPAPRSMVYPSAGHMPGYVLGGSGAVRARLDSPGIPLGILAEGDFPPAAPVPLQPGDLVFFYTDGVVEATAPDGSLFGIERALDVIRATRGESAHQIVQALERSSREYAHQERRHDDFTSIVTKLH